MNENTGIRIEAVKEVNRRDDPGYRITKIKALNAQDLPKTYTNGERHVAIMGTGWIDPNERLYLYDCKKPTFVNGFSYIWPRFYSTQEMEKINAHIKAAGQHLADTNVHLRKERKTWQGKVTFVDGETIENEWAKDVLSEEPEQLYKIIDGSWNLCSTNTGMAHILEFQPTNGKYRIISEDCNLPASQGCARTPQRNDTIVQNVDTGQIVFTCARFLCRI